MLFADWPENFLVNQKQEFHLALAFSGTCAIIVGAQGHLRASCKLSRVLQFPRTKFESTVDQIHTTVDQIHTCDNSNDGCSAELSCILLVILFKEVAIF